MAAHIIAPDRYVVKLFLHRQLLKSVRTSITGIQLKISRKETAQFRQNNKCDDVHRSLFSQM